ncbi:MAG TPA: TonB-dependent receptor [Cytophagaceae bacterium]|jgi:iron complex outermembrane receptor protein|nr:TonB-dependent receptor [Cytophagaceae bacterium]
MNKKILLLTMLLLASYIGYGQVADSTTTMTDLSLEELMNVQVVSASKKSESVFEAPLSIGSVSREEIQRSGVTSIVEALRLIPGLLVTEMSNGNYQVDIRGLNNLPPATAINNASNSISLVMIDNRPVYNYFNGGTFWETIPVDLNDVERIEVVRGASSALYGPNAAAGVINIITRKIDKDGLYVVANAQGGNPSTYIGNASVGYKVGKFDAIASGNFQTRNRTETDYYNWATQTRVSSDSITSYFPGGPLVDVHNNPNASTRYPSPKSAMNKLGYNAFLNYTISEKSNIGLSFGGQQSRVQKAFTDNLATPLSTQESSTNYVDARVKLNNWNTMLAYQFGTQDVARGSNGYKYNFNTIDFVTEYDINFKNLSLKPGVSFRNAVYDDSKYADIANGEGFINGSKTLTDAAASLRAEYKVKEKLKIIGAVRTDFYNHPSKAYTSYQFAPSYKISDRHFVRGNYSRSYRGPNMYDTYNSSSILVGSTQVAPGVFFPDYAKIVGDQNIKLLSIDLFELGYRSKITDNFHIELDAFHQTVQNYTFLVGQPNQVDMANGRVIIPQTVENISMKTIQDGITISANYVQNKFQIKPFVTIQTTQLKYVPKYRSSYASDSVNNVSVTYNATHKGTPSVFGGAYVNYKISKKFNANVSIYYFGSYQYNNIYSNFAANPNNGIVNVSSKFLLNARFAYKPIEQLDLFVNLRNALNQTSFEFAQTDKTVLMFLVGASFKY